MLGAILLAMFVVSSQASTLLSQSLKYPPPPSAQDLPPREPLENWPPAGVVRQGPGVTMPKLIKDVKPSYRAEAMRNGVRGTVFLEAVVTPDGSVGEVRVVRSLDKAYGMDDEAVECVKQWKFAAGTKGGKAVPVLVEVEMAFTLDRPPKR